MNKVYEQDDCAPDALDGVGWLEKNKLISDNDFCALVFNTDEESNKFYFAQATKKYYRVARYLNISDTVFETSKDEIIDFIKEWLPNLTGT